MTTSTQAADGFVANYDLRRRINRLAAVKQELEWLRCKHDFVYFWENYWHIEHPSYGAVTADMYPGMRDLHEFLDLNIHTCILKGRQIGCSTFIAGYVFHKLFFFDMPRTALFFSKTKDDAVELLRNVAFGYERLDAWLIARGPQRTNANTQNFRLSNGSKIESLASKKNAGRSRTAWIVVLDEWAFYEDQADAWASVEPVTQVGLAELKHFKTHPWDCGGRMIALSTANASGDFFNNFWDQSVKGTNGFAARFLSSMIPPSRDDAWYEDMKTKLPEWQLHREYPIDPALAFLKAGNPIFDVDKLKDLKTAEWFPCRTEQGVDGVVRMVKSDNGMLRWFDGERDTNYFLLDDDYDHRYIISADTAQGVDGGDFSSADVIRIPYWTQDGTYVPMEQVAHFYGRLDPDEFGHELARLGRFFNGAYIVPESNNHGGTTIHALVREAGYRKVYYRKVKRSKREKATKELGFYTSVGTKAALIDGLKRRIREDEIAISSEQTRVECIGYVRTKSGKMEGHPHDDCVMSLALAVEGVGDKYDDFRGADVTSPASKWSFNALWMDERIRQQMEASAGYVVS